MLSICFSLLVISAIDNTLTILQYDSKMVAKFFIGLVLPIIVCGVVVAGPAGGNQGAREIAASLA